MNQDKINQIDNRMEEIVRLSSTNNINTQTDNTLVIGGERIERQYLGEYNALMLLKNILRENTKRISDIPYVNRDDVMIREDLIEDYERVSKIVNLPSLNYVSNSIKNENDEVLQNEKNIAYENIDELSLDNKEDYIQKVDSAKNADEVYAVINDAVNNKKEETIEEPAVESQTNKENFDNLINKKVEAINKVNTLNVPDKNDVLNRIMNAKSEDDINAILNGKTVDEQKELDELKKEMINKIENSNLTNEDKETFKKAVNNANDKDFIDSVMKSVDEKIKENELSSEYAPVADDQQLAVVPEKNLNKPMIQENIKRIEDNNSELDDEMHEVSKVRKAINFLKKHKKKIIIGLGLTTLAATLFVPGVGPALMCANSKLWASTSVPLFRGVLHGANCVLASMIGATEVSSGLWAFASTGALINETAAASSLLGALAGGALQVASTVGIVKGISEAKNKVVDWFKKKRKSKKEDVVEEIDKNLTPEVEEKTEKEKTNEKVKDTNLIDKLNDRRTYLAKMLSKANTTDQVNEIQREMIKLDSAIDKINDGRNTPITETVDYKGYRVKPDDVEKLNEIVGPKITEEEVKSATTSLKEKYQAAKDAIIKTAEKFKTPEDIKEGSIKK